MNHDYLFFSFDIIIIIIIFFFLSIGVIGRSSVICESITIRILHEMPICKYHLISIIDLFGYLLQIEMDHFGTTGIGSQSGRRQESH